MEQNLLLLIIIYSFSKLVATFYRFQYVNSNRFWKASLCVWSVIKQTLGMHFKFVLVLEILVVLAVFCMLGIRNIAGNQNMAKAGKDFLSVSIVNLYGIVFKTEFFCFCARTSMWKEISEFSWISGKHDDSPFGIVRYLCIW